MGLNPFVIQMLEQLKGRPSICEGTPEEGRAMLAQTRAVYGDGPEMVQAVTLNLPSRGGDLTARLLVPTDNPAGLIVYLHGGGWVVGSIKDFEALGRSLALASGCAVLLPEYRLAPEYPFPAALEDTEDALLWCFGEMEMRFGNALPLIVAGDSAGGNLAAVVANRLAGRLPLAMQVLFYPVTDCDFTRPSYAKHGTGFPLTASDMRWFFELYAPGGDWTRPDISPLRQPDPSTAPPALVVTAEYDVLRDEGHAYAAALRAAGVPVSAREMTSVPHGFIRWHNLMPEVQAEIASIGAQIARACSETVKP